MKKIIFTIVTLSCFVHKTFSQNITFEEVVNISTYFQSEQDIMPLYQSKSDMSDIDGDGDLDLIISGRKDIYNYVYTTLLYKNDGNGNFSISNNSLLGDYQPGDLKFFDADGDNDSDLIISGFTSNTKTTQLYLNDGDGNYTLKPNTLFISAYELDIEDIDGDGDLDIFIIGIDNNSQRQSIMYINDGIGNFSSQNSFFELAYNGDVKFIDYDNDNDQDLIYSGSRFHINQTQTFSYKYENDGNGNFTLVSDSSFSAITQGAIDVADIDGDNDLDFVITGLNGVSSSSPLITELYLNDGLGNFALSNTSTFEELYKSDVKFIDIDNDNDKDMILSGAYNYSISHSNYNSYSKSLVYKNDGNGVFTLDEPRSLESVYYNSISYGDIDGDNDLDIFLSGKSDNINTQLLYSNFYINNGDGDFSKKGASIIKHLKYSSSEFLDIDNDGDEDLIIIGQDKNEEAVTELYKNNGHGEYTTYDNSSFEHVYIGDITYGDIDNDSDNDIIITGKNDQDAPSLNIYKNDGNGNFSQLNDSIVENIFDGSIHLADIDGDNDLDLFIQGEKKITFHSTVPVAILYKNDGNGVFSISNDSTFRAVEQGTSKLKDVDNDGDIDLFIMGDEQNYGPKLRSYKNDGNGNFTTSNVFTGGYNGDFELEDLNGDSYLDLLVNPSNTSFNLTPKIYFNDQSGGYNVQNTTNIDNLFFNSIKTIDIDNDGDLDLLQSGLKSTTNILQLYLNNGNGNFQSKKSLFSDYGVSNGKISISDIDNDNDFDFFISGEDRYGKAFSQLFKNDSSGNFIPLISNGFIPLYNTSSDYADIDGDNDLDLIICGSNNNSSPTPSTGSFQYDPKCFVYINQNNGYFKLSPSHIVPNVSYGTSNFVDIDNDNDYDLILAGYTDLYPNHTSPMSKTFILENDGLGNFDTIPHNIIDFGFGTVNPIDIDNDGDEDLFITGDDSTILYLNDGLGNYTEKPNPFIGVRESTVDIGDVNGDNKLDILIYGINSTLNHVTTLYLNTGNNNFIIDNNFSYNSLNSTSFKFGDFDNDNDLDIFMIGFSFNSPTSYILVNDGSGNFSMNSSSDFGSATYANIEVIDIDYDNDQDIIINGKINNSDAKTTTSIYLNDSYGNFNLLEGTNILNTKHRGSLELFDIDNDNDQDILVTGAVYQGFKQVRLYRNTSCLNQNYNLNVQACSSYTSPSGLHTFSSNGTYQITDTISKMCGADSILDITLTIGPDLSSDSISSCFEYTWIDGNTYYTSNNTATHTLTNQFGCDSIITLNLTIQTVDTSSSYTDSSITINQNNATYQWFDCNNNSILTGETNQTIMPFTNGTYKAIINHNNCIDTSSCLTISPCNERELIHVSNSSICDTSSSILSIINNYDSYLWSNGNTLDSIIVNDSMMYYATLGMNNGCITYTDSIKLNLYDCTIFIDSTTTSIDTCLIDSTTTVSQAYINNIITQDDSVYVTWNFLLSSGDTIFLDASYYVSQNGIYNVSITINCNGLKANGTSYFDLLEVSHLTDVAVDSKLDTPFKLFPNPTNNTLYISGSENSNTRIEVLATNGTLIKQTYLRPNNILEIDLSNFESALYFIKITPENSQSLIYKVIKK